MVDSGSLTTDYLSFPAATANSNNHNESPPPSSDNNNKKWGQPQQQQVNVHINANGQTEAYNKSIPFVATTTTSLKTISYYRHDTVKGSNRRYYYVLYRSKSTFLFLLENKEYPTMLDISKQHSNFSQEFANCNHHDSNNHNDGDNGTCAQRFLISKDDWQIFIKDVNNTRIFSRSVAKFLMYLPLLVIAMIIFVIFLRCSVAAAAAGPDESLIVVVGIFNIGIITTFGIIVFIFILPRSDAELYYTHWCFHRQVEHSIEELQRRLQQHDDEAVVLFHGQYQQHDQSQQSSQYEMDRRSSGTGSPSTVLDVDDAVTTNINETENENLTTIEESDETDDDTVPSIRIEDNDDEITHPRVIVSLHVKPEKTNVWWGVVPSPSTDYYVP